LHRESKRVHDHQRVSDDLPLHETHDFVWYTRTRMDDLENPLISQYTDVYTPNSPFWSGLRLRSCMIWSNADYRPQSNDGCRLSESFDSLFTPRRLAVYFLVCFNIEPEYFVLRWNVTNIIV
jgi:hypothetical protein